jgi:phosphorylase kinase alpha/beta subunit
LTLLVEHGAVTHLGAILNVEQLVHAANQIFLEDQKRMDGDATLCCAGSGPGGGSGHPTQPCNGAAYICTPSGSFGTMSYLIRAVATTLDCLPKDGDIDCSIS